MVESYDVGSLPFEGEQTEFLEGALLYGLKTQQGSAQLFERTVLQSFLDKLEAGIDVPNYPQFRDMNDMFLLMMDGIEKIEGGYVEVETPSLKSGAGAIPEVAVLKENAELIHTHFGKPFELKVCVTGPYTLAALFPYRSKRTFLSLADLLAKIVEKSIFKNKHGEVALLVLDEPVFGLLSDPLIDYGSEGREALLKAWETIFHVAKARNVRTGIHLHNTSDGLFWQVESLQIVDSHVEDPLYEMKSTKKRLEEEDKFLKASILISNFDQLVRNQVLAASSGKASETALNEQIAKVWRQISSGILDPTTFLEDANLAKQRLADVVERFGVERVLYAGPECGLRGFPSYTCAIECLRRATSAVEAFKKG